ncbi:hypothetical protein F0919_17320 [Taibaiella lutea]|uniref:Cytochrome B n=1 Tax=Taibaiella lutea TaxID=2608001 RepID=A0A5M6CC21_9BACT|nr:hypothetical protein [Taibaiella lutea]KAA5532543.1 hypothetical protein F0919_17320 [Taibaiella lutea]
MYQTFTFYHNLTRWFVLASLLYAIYRACKGYISKAVFSRTDNAVRHWTATIAHIQLMIGIILYFQSPVIKYFMSDFKEAIKNSDTVFFGLIHGSLMLTAITVLTIGSAKAKRMKTDSGKFKVMLIWFSLALIIIFIAIPWPFSPLAKRPYFR